MQYSCTTKAACILQSFWNSPVRRTYADSAYFIIFFAAMVVQVRCLLQHALESTEL